MRNLATNHFNKQDSFSDAKFDVLKFILSFLVVAIHTQLFPMMLYPWLRLAVPLFFTTTSYFLFDKLKKIDDFNSQLSVIKKFIIRNLKLYFFWFVVLLPITLYIRKELYLSGGLLMGLLNFIKSFLFGSTFVASWYIMASVIGVILIFFASKKIGNKTLLGITAVIYILIALKSSYYSVFEQNSIINTIVNTYNIFLRDPVLSFPSSLFWIACGKSFAEGTFKLKRNSYIIICIISCILLYAEWHFVRKLNGTFNNDCYLLLPPVCIGIFGWLLSCKPLHIPGSIYLRRCSTVVYALHGSIARIIGFGFKVVFDIEIPFLNFIVVSLISLTAYIFIEVILHYKKQNKILGLLKYSY